MKLLFQLAMTFLALVCLAIAIPANHGHKGHHGRMKEYLPAEDGEKKIRQRDAMGLEDLPKRNASKHREAILPVIPVIFEVLGLGLELGLDALFAKVFGKRNDMKTRLNDATGNNQLGARYEGLAQAMDSVEGSKKVQNLLRMAIPANNGHHGHHGRMKNSLRMAIPIPHGHSSHGHHSHGYRPEDSVVEPKKEQNLLRMAIPANHGHNGHHGRMK